MAKKQISRSIMNKGTRLLGSLILGVLALIFTVTSAKQLFVTNSAGYYIVKQAAFSGNMTILDQPGVYARFFGDVTTYHVSDVHYFSKSKLDGGDGIESDPVSVQFTDGGRAEISGAIKFRLPSVDNKRLFLTVTSSHTLL